MIPICYTADSGYAMQVAVSMISMLENNRNTDLEFYILGDNYSDEIKKKFEIIQEEYNKKIHIIDISHRLRIFNDTALSKEEGVMRDGVISFMFARLFMGSCLPDEIEKVIYIDCDTIYIGNISELYATDIENEFIYAAVRDLWPKSYNRVIGLDENELYFQSGIMLVNLNRWRSLKCENQIIEVAKMAKHYYFMHDQDLLNLCFHGKIQTLSPKFGMIYLLRKYTAKECLWFSGKDREHYYSEEEINDAKNDVHVIHYAGDYYGRPWSFPKACKDNREWLRYYMLSPWKLDTVGNRHSYKEWTKYYVKKLLAPFVGKFWLKRTKKRFEVSNEWMLTQSMNRKA